MSTKQRALVAIYVLIAAVVSAGVMWAVQSATSDACAPEARQAALQQDASDVLAGRITLDEATSRQADRTANCG